MGNEQRAARPRVVADMGRLLTVADGGPLRVGQVLEDMEDRGYALALILLTLPFVLPFPTFGLSAPVGFALAATGFGLAIGRGFALPPFLRKLEIRNDLLTSAASWMDRALARVGHLSRPRLRVFLGPAARVAFGVSLFCCAAILGLPLPLPLGNFFPAMGILLLAAGLLEEDGVLVLAGHAVTAGVCGGLYATAGLAWAAVLRMVAWVL